MASLVYITTSNFSTSWPPAISLCHGQQFLLSVLIVIVFLVGVMWYLTVVLTCSSLIASYIEHFKIYSLSICVSFLEKYVSYFYLIRLYFLYYIYIKSYIKWTQLYEKSNSRLDYINYSKIYSIDMLHNGKEVDLVVMQTLNPALAICLLVFEAEHQNSFSLLNGYNVTTSCVRFLVQC